MDLNTIQYIMVPMRRIKIDVISASRMGEGPYGGPYGDVWTVDMLFCPLGCPDIGILPLYILVVTIHG